MADPLPQYHHALAAMPDDLPFAAASRRAKSSCARQKSLILSAVGSIRSPVLEPTPAKVGRVAPNAAKRPRRSQPSRATANTRRLWQRL